jgi:hypothetical protein
VPEPRTVLECLVIGDTLAASEIVEHAKGSDDVVLLVATSVFARDRQLLRRAERLAQTTSHRHLVAIAAAHLADDTERVRELARDHLADHPESVLVAWITARSDRSEQQRASAPTATPPDPSGSRLTKVSP